MFDRKKDVTKNVAEGWRHCQGECAICLCASLILMCLCFELVLTRKGRISTIDIVVLNFHRMLVIYLL